APAQGHTPPRRQAGLGLGPHTREPVQTERDRHPARGTPAGLVQRHEVAPGIPLELPAYAPDRLEHTAGDHLRHVRPHLARPVRRARDRRHAPHPCAHALRRRELARRGGRPERLRRRAPRRRRALPRGLSYLAAATGLDSLAFFSGLGLDSLFLVSPFEPESPVDVEEESEEELSLEEDSPEPDEELSAEAAFSRWRLRVP